MVDQLITEEKAQKKLFALCWVFYFASYLGRYNYSGIMADLISTDVLTEATGGLIATGYFVSYGFGQILNGYLADKVKSENMICLGLFASAVCNFFMTMGESYQWFLAIWFFNGFFQSMIWSPIVSIFVNLLPEEKRANSFVNIASSMAFGTLTAYFLTSATLSLGGWRLSFLVPATILAVVSVAGYLIFKEIRTHGVAKVEEYNLKGIDSTDADASTNVRVNVRVNVNTNAAIKVNTKGPGDGLFLMILIVFLPTIIYGMLKDGVSAWVPTMLFQNFNVSTTIATGFAMILPIINLSGAYMAKYVFAKLK